MPIVWTKDNKVWVEGIVLLIGTMIFKVLFSQFSFAEIRPAFLNLWQTNGTELVNYLGFGQMGKKNLSRTRQALEASSSRNSISAGMALGSSPMIDMNCSVYDKVGQSLDCAMACYPSWPEMAGMEVVVEKDICDYASRACCRLCCGKSLTLVGDRRDRTKEYGKNISWRNENETRAYCHVHLDIHYFCHNASPACLALWRNVGRTVDKDINRI